MQTGDKTATETATINVSPRPVSAMATREIVAKLAAAGDGDQGNVAHIGEGDNFETEGRPNLATATTKESPLSARATIFKLKGGRSWRRRHFNRRRCPRTGIGEGDTWCRYRRGRQLIRRRSPRAGIGEGDTWCRYRRGRHFIRRRSPRTGIGEGDNWCR